MLISLSISLCTLRVQTDVLFETAVSGPPLTRILLSVVNFCCLTRKLFEGDPCLLRSRGSSFLSLTIFSNFTGFSTMLFVLLSPLE